MKPLYILIVLTLSFCGTSIFSQQTPADRILKAEQSIKVFYSSNFVADRLLNQYGTTPFVFKVKNRTFIDNLFSDLIEQYKNQNFSFDTIEDYFFDQISNNLTQLDLTDLTIPSAPSPPIMTNRAAGDPCNNMDFETGDLTGWEMYEGKVNGAAAVITNTTQIFTPGAHHTIMGAGTDAVCSLPTTNPNGGASSLRLGDGTGTGYNAASIRQTFLVSNSNAVFTYSYAVVLQDPGGHTQGEKPFFKVNVYDQNGASIVCGEFVVVANSNLGNGWNSFSGGFYKDWSTVFVPLDSYIGQNVTIEFISGDCNQGGHYGYAYVDAECSPLELIPPGTLLCGNDQLTLSAPAGAQSYLWNTGATTQDIEATQAGNYSVQVTPVQGSACAITLTANIISVPEFPTTEFTPNPISVCLGDDIVFTDNTVSSNGTAINYWDWTMDDGSTNLSIQNPTYQYADTGVYDVQLISGFLVPGQGGCYDTIIHTVTVEDSPIAGFTSTYECEGTVTQFTDTSSISIGNITNWDWDFTSNGSIDNTTQNPTNGYSSAGTFNATLTVTSAGGCSNSITLPVVVNPVPNANFTHLDVCDGEVINFTNTSSILTGSITDWLWDFGDMTGTAITEDATYTYANPGVYNTTLTVTSDSGCIDNITTPVEMFNNPIADFNFSDVCDGVAVNFSDASNGNGSTINQWDYDFNNNGTVDYSGANTSYTYPSAGSYDINLYVETVDGCFHDSTKSITVFPNPIANFTGQNVCEGNNVTFTENSTGNINAWNWQFGNGGVSIIQNPTELYNFEGVFNVSLTVTTTDNCVHTYNSPVEIYPTPNPQFLATDVCDGNAATFTDFSTVSNQYTTNTITTWNWDYGTTPASSSTGQFGSHIYPQDGSYTVTLDVVTNNNCTNSVQAPVTIHPNPVIDFTSPNPDGCTTWCPDFTNNCHVSSGTIVTYLWDFGDGNTSLNYAPNHCYDNNTLQNISFDITLTATSDQGCVTTDSELALITVYPNPVADFTIDHTTRTIYDPVFEFTNTSLLNDNNLWNFSNLGTSTDVDPSYTFSNEDEGTYVVCLEVTTQYGCIDDTCQTVNVEGIANLYVANTFTPDGDGINDFFKPAIYGYSEENYTFMIFDRWGLLIYQTNNINNSWDGRFKGSDVQQDTYVWKLKAQDRFTGDEVSLIGHINVLR